ncbi:probable disease resistance protein At5g66900 [Arachis stenosperma]|uniref:probable disease resistance protein At5g66900 n=1 Tax=Arachis stenosperma TaxID=217475 RepID=UPI0025ABEF39|nr:probable disease resistance protein At5g66900 [Arachis stenosperma]
MGGATAQQQELESIIEEVKTAQRCKQTRRILKSTLKGSKPLVYEIKQYNNDLDQPRDEIKALINENGAAQDSESPCCNCFSSCSLWFGKYFFHIPFYRIRSVRSERNSYCDAKEMLSNVRDVLELLSRQNIEKRLSGGSIKRRPCGFPEKPGFTVGLDEPLRRLKVEVLMEGVSVIVLTGLGGSGKTTLATMLCFDEQVKDKFDENILFVTFSKNPKLKTIVERLFEQCGYQVPEFKSDNDAVNQMVVLLRHIGTRPTLLVLDDVWPGSEALVEKFQIQMSQYKILVTSRVAFPRFASHFILKPLNQEDALTLFRHYALLERSCSDIPNEDIVQKVVSGCKGSPLAIMVMARSLSRQPYGFWLKIVEKLSQGHSILDSNAELVNCLQKILEVLQNKPFIKECFMDLGLFPEDQRIPVTALIDIWKELYGLDDDGQEAMTIINILDSMNLVKLSVARKSVCGVDNYYYNNHFLVLHDLVRELAIYQSNQEPIERRQRLMIDVNENASQRWLGKKQKGMMMARISSYLTRCVKQKAVQVTVRTLSISTDEAYPSLLSNVKTDETEVLIVDLRTKQYSFPESIEKMNKLKVIIVTNYGFHPSELNNFEKLSSLSNLRRIRLERISAPPLVILKNLRKISLYMCNMTQVFQNGNIPISEAFPNLVELSIDYCKDMVKLPNELCDITPLKNISITNCHKFNALPQDIGKLSKLELLRLSCCTDLQGLPNSIGRLSILRLLDISNCMNLPDLPEDIGNLRSLRNLYMTGCSNCELPFSVANLENLKVICDEETAASWEAFMPIIPNLKVEVPQVDVNLNWLHPLSS